LLTLFTLFTAYTCMGEYDLSGCPLFQGLSQEEITQIMERSVAEVRTLQKGAYVARQGDTIRFLYLLVDGLVRTEMITKEGNIIEIDFIEAVHPLAPAFIFAGQNRFPVDVVASVPCVFYMIPDSVWLQEMMKNKELLLNFMRLNSNMTVFLANKLQLFTIKSLKGRLSLYILENTTPLQNSFILKRTQTQLAEYFGVQRPSLARTIGEMINEEIITLYKRKLTVLDRERMEKLI